MPTPVLMPKLGNSVESSLILKWCKRTGEKIGLGEVLCEIETDKATMEVESQAEGVLLEVLYNEGDEVPVQTVIAYIGTVGETVPSSQTEVSANKTTTVAVSSQNQPTISPRPAQAKRDGRFASPRARNFAKREGLRLEDVLAGSGPNGRILERDVLAAIKQPKVQPADSTLPTPPTQPSLRPPEEGVTATPLKGIRKRIATRMLESLQTTAQLTLHTSADARELQRVRSRLKAIAAKDASLPNITLNHLILLVVARTLQNFPNLNAHLEHDVLYEYRGVHLGFAVDTERGLIVPVIRNAHRLGLRQLASQTNRLAEESLEAKIVPDDLQGGTFTVSNLGAFGIENFTPILNPPQVAILGVGSIQPKPMQVGENVEFVPHLNLSLTVNHMVVDGAPAARFLQALCQNFVNLESLML